MPAYVQTSQEAVHRAIAVSLMTRECCSAGSDPGSISAPDWNRPNLNQLFDPTDSIVFKTPMRICSRWLAIHTSGASWQTSCPRCLKPLGGPPDPDQALNHWERWLASGVSRSAVLEYLRSAPRMLDLVCAIFGNSDSLAFTLVRDPLLLYWLAQQNVLSTAPTRGDGTYDPAKSGGCHRH